MSTIACNVVFENFEYQCTGKQECIPVGCVPPTCCLYLPGPDGVPGLGVPGPGDVPGPGGVPGASGCTWSQGVYLAQGCTWFRGCALSWGVYLVPGGGVPAQVLPPVNRMTNRCKNITLPQTSFAGGKKKRYILFTLECLVLVVKVYNALIFQSCNYQRRGQLKITFMVRSRISSPKKNCRGLVSPISSKF